MIYFLHFVVYKQIEVITEILKKNYHSECRSAQPANMSYVTSLITQFITSTFYKNWKLCLLKHTLNESDIHFIYL